MDLDAAVLALPEADEELAAFGLEQYRGLILNKGSLGVHTTHDGHDAFFWHNRFEHAFYQANSRANWGISKDAPSRSRIAKMPWIIPVISGAIEGVECWSVPGRKDVHPPSRNRLYILWRKGYLVFLEPYGEKRWRFSTAFPTAMNQIRDQFCRGGAKIWPYKEKAP